MLAKVDFKSRYYYHGLGVLWALIKPLIELLVYYFIFSQIFVSDIDNFALYIFSGLVLWYFFAEGTGKGLQVFTTKRYLIESIQFNKLDLFISSTLSAFFGFVFNLTVYLIVSAFFGVFPLHINALFFIPLLLNLVLLIFAMSLLVATTSIYLKDIQHLWDMILLVGFWATPVVYSYSLVAEKFPSLLYWYPVAGIIANGRTALLYTEIPDLELMGYNFLITIFLLIIGVLVFKKFSVKAAEKY